MTQSIFPITRIIDGIDYQIDTDKARLDVILIHTFLAQSHWAKSIPLTVVERSIAHSLTFGIYRGGRQVAFARVVTDHATFAYLADVFVVAVERRQGLGRWLVETALAHPELQGLRRWLLGTRDAQALYRRCGFREAPPPFAFMERLDARAYAPRRRRAGAAA